MVTPNVDAKIYLDRPKLETSNFVHYSVLFKFWEIIDNISEMVQ